MRKKVKFHLEDNVIIFDEEFTMFSNDKMIYDYEYDEGKGHILKNIYFESSMPIEKKAIEVINILLSHLPDSVHDDRSWNRSWETLSGEAQEAVKVARNRGWELVTELVDKVMKKKEDENANPNV